MILRKCLKPLVVLIVLLGLFANALAAKQPNIVLILADDLGYGDLGCYGNPNIRTPNIDRMASESLRFTEFYAGACLCTPSRAALLTGRLAIRTGMAGGPGRHVLYPTDVGGLPVNEITIPGALKTKGYVTAAVGKWHLGHLPQFLPTSHGFDSFFGLPYSNDMDATSRKFRDEDSNGQNPDWHHFNVPLMRGTNIIERPADQSTLTKRYTAEAIEFIKQNKKKPFFLYFAHTFPHVPLFASEAFKGKSDRGLYGDTVEEVDWSVGEVLKTLREQKLEENTLVFFTSDNGPWLVRKLNGGSAGLLRDGKGGTWEGGYRVPMIARWPSKIKPGITHEVASGIDLFNTCLALGGASIPTDRPQDGVDMSPILFQTGPSKRDLHFYYYGDQLYAVRKGKYKAHFTTHDGYSKEPAEKHDPALLFNVQEDPSERFNIAADHADIVADLKTEFEKHRSSIVPGKPQY